MSNVPADLRYLKSHEWARLEADGTLTIGISDHAQQALGDLVFVEAPEAGPSRRRQARRARSSSRSRRLRTSTARSAAKSWPATPTSAASRS